MNKKSQTFAYVLLLSGTMLFGLMHLAIALYIPNFGGWSTPPGKLITVLNEIMGLVPYVLSILFILIGLLILLVNSSDKA